MGFNESYKCNQQCIAMQWENLDEFDDDLTKATSLMIWIRGIFPELTEVDDLLLVGGFKHLTNFSIIYGIILPID